MIHVQLRKQMQIRLETCKKGVTLLRVDVACGMQRYIRVMSTSIATFTGKSTATKRCSAAWSNPYALWSLRTATQRQRNNPRSSSVVTFQSRMSDNHNVRELCAVQVDSDSNNSSSSHGWAQPRTQRGGTGPDKPDDLWWGDPTIQYRTLQRPCDVVDRTRRRTRFTDHFAADN